LSAFTRARREAENAPPQWRALGKECVLTSARAVHRPAAIHADARSLRYTYPCCAGTDSRSDADTVCADAGCADADSRSDPDTGCADPDARSDADTGRADTNSWSDADTGRSGIMLGDGRRPHDASPRQAARPAIDLGFTRRGEKRQEEKCESNLA
jgi:hypothetical protein